MTEAQLALPVAVRTRLAVMWAAAAAGLAAYNWWVPALLRPGLRSPSELFSNLEVAGQPFAAAMQHADLLSGLLLLAALLATGAHAIAGGEREWLAMAVFAAAGALGGLFPEVCADEVSAACRAREAAFALPVQQYLHIAAGIGEFGGATIVIVLAFRRTRGAGAASARIYRVLLAGLAVAYPLLGAAYLLDRLGAVAEAVFFTGFTTMALTWFSERGGVLHGRAGGPPAG